MRQREFCRPSPSATRKSRKLQEIRGLVEKLSFASLILMVILCAMPSTALYAQGSQAAITGTIKDQSGAIVRNAAVRATNIKTGVSFKTMTNGDGLYTISLMPIGTYEANVTAREFETAIQHFELHGGDRLQIDFQLKAGSMTQTVVVNSAAPLLETTTGDSGLTVSAAQVHDLPIIGRNPFVLATLAPGVALQPGLAESTSDVPYGNGGFDALMFNGGPRFTAEATIDGLADTSIDNGSSAAPATITFAPPTDMTQELRVQTTSYDAQYGRSGGGFIAINLKNGTNQFHGEMYDYVRNTVFNANDYSDNRAGIKRAPFHWNEPGLELDGPVYIPKLYDGRNKTFFMFGWEDIRTSSPEPIYVSVPTALERNGNFSQSLAGGKAAAIYDPLTTAKPPGGTYQRTSFPNSQIPSDRIDPVAAKIVNLIPLPNLPEAGNVDNLFAGPNSFTDAYDIFIYRLNHTINRSQRITATYLYSDRNQVEGLDGFPVSIAPTYHHHRTNYGVHVNWTWTISPSLVSSFGIGWNEHRFAILNQQPHFDLSTLGFPSYVNNPFTGSLFPHISMSGYTSFGNAGFGAGLVNVSDNYDLRETLIKTLHKHDISFGGEIRPMRDGLNFAADNSTFSFTKSFTQAHPFGGDAVSGSGFASFLLGYAASGLTTQAPVPNYKDAYYAAFVQDDWHVNDRLSLTLGLRWDTESPQVETHGEQNVGFKPNAAYNFAGQALRGEVLFSTDGGAKKAYNWGRNNFGPRLGFAYRLSTNAVVRGGYGVLYSPVFDVPSEVGFSATTQ